MTRTSYIWWDDDDVRFVLDKHAQTHYPDSEPTSLCSNINFIVFDLTQMGLKPTIYLTQDEQANHYTTDVFYFQLAWATSNKIFICWKLYYLIGIVDESIVIKY